MGVELAGVSWDAASLWATGGTWSSSTSSAMAPGPQGSKSVCSQAPSDPTCLACRQQSDCASTRLTPSDPPLPTVAAHDTIHTHHTSHITQITHNTVHRLAAHSSPVIHAFVSHLPVRGPLCTTL